MFWIELLLLFVLFFFLCYSNTGTDKKNMLSYSSYPDAIQALIKQDETLSSMIKITPFPLSFLSNLLLFGIILFVFGLFIRTSDFIHNFFALLILGQSVNLFDLLIIDLLWWRNSPRIRFQRIHASADLYKDPSKHIASFSRAIILFTIIAVADGFLLTLF